MSLERTRFLAKGDISPSRIVRMDTTASVDFGVLQAAAATDKVIGVSQIGSRKFPSSTGSADDALAAKNGETLEVFQDGNECTIELGGTVVPGDYLKSDANGRAVAVTFAEVGNLYFVGRALEHGVNLNKIRMKVQTGTARPA